MNSAIADADETIETRDSAAYDWSARAAKYAALNDASLTRDAAISLFAMDWNDWLRPPESSTYPGTNTRKRKRERASSTSTQTIAAPLPSAVPNAESTSITEASTQRAVTSVQPSALKATTKKVSKPKTAAAVDPSPSHARKPKRVRLYQVRWGPVQTQQTQYVAHDFQSQRHPTQSL
nr:hypothetical protein B0A51_07442 [Rachicladosporium sp. CCFEE 5018]